MSGTQAKWCVRIHRGHSARPFSARPFSARPFGWLRRLLALPPTNTYDVCMQGTLRPKRSMVRKQIFITAEQNARLKALAAASGKAEGQLMRDGLDKVLVEEEGDTEDWKAGLMKLKGMWKDRADLDELFTERRKKRRERRDRMNEVMKRGRS